MQPLEAELALVRAELEQVTTNHNRAMQEQKKLHEAELSKLSCDQGNILNMYPSVINMLRHIHIS